MFFKVYFLYTKMISYPKYSFSIIDDSKIFFMSYVLQIFHYSEPRYGLFFRSDFKIVFKTCDTFHVCID